MNRRPAAVLRQGAAELAAARVAAADAEARVLLQHISGLSATALLVANELDEAVVTSFAAAVTARATGIPLQHLTGRAWFRTVELEVGLGVFIPRPETEVVAQAAIDEARSRGGGLVVELCAGSGAISAALLAEVPTVQVIAVEKDPAAASWARRNLAGSGAEVIEADMADGLPRYDAQVDIVIANPPYIAYSQADLLPAEVRHDPELALFAADEGMAAIRVVIAVARRLLRPGGLVVIEHGDDQAPAALAELARAGFAQPTSHRDLTRRARFVTARAVTGWDGE